MKVYVLISGTALPRKSKDARQAVLETVQYLNGNNDYVGAYETVVPDDGPNSRVHWLCKYQSMGDQEKDVEMRGKDAEWATVFAKVDETVDVDNISSQTFRVKE